MILMKCLIVYLSGVRTRYIIYINNIIYLIMKNLVLTKESSSEQIKSYFNAILDLKQNNQEYPINLDDVWALVYSRKDKAVLTLRENFIENEDFKVFAQKVENSKGGRPKEDYMLSLSCMEYFIARKVRPVFEVYRQVFHKVAKQPKQLSGAEFLLQQAQLMVEQERRLSNIEQEISTMKQERENNSKMLLAVSVSSELLPELSMRDKIRKLVNTYSSASNISQRDVWHKIYDQLYYLYHISIKAYKKSKSESLIDVAEKNNLLDKMYTIVSNMVRELK